MTAPAHLSRSAAIVPAMATTNAIENALAIASSKYGLRIMAFVSGSMSPTQRQRARDLKTKAERNVL